MRKLLLWFPACYVRMLARLRVLIANLVPTIARAGKRLAKKAGGVVVLLAPLEAMDAVYEFRQENNFYYLSGVTVPGAGLLVAPAVEAKGDTPARAYTEISVSAAAQSADWRNSPDLRWGRTIPTPQRRLVSIGSKRWANCRKKSPNLWRTPGPSSTRNWPRRGNTPASEDLVGFLKAQQCDGVLPGREADADFAADDQRCRRSCI